MLLSTQHERHRQRHEDRRFRRQTHAQARGSSAQTSIISPDDLLSLSSLQYQLGPHTLRYCNCSGLGLTFWIATIALTCTSEIPASKQTTVRSGNDGQQEDEAQLAKNISSDEISARMTLTTQEQGDLRLATFCDNTR